MLYKLNYCMYRIAIIFMLVASTALAVPQPYPIGVDSQTRSVPALEMYQAEPFTVRATFRSGGVAEDVSTVTPFMYWATSAGATNYVTSSWSRVNGGTTGVVDFTFSAAALNTNGDLIYGVGAGSTFRQGALKIRANPFASGVASPTFTLATNLAGISFINYPWLDSVSLYQGNSNHAAVSGNGLVIMVRTNYGGGSITSESDPIFVAASNALLTKAQASSLYATGTPVYTESDPLFVAASNALLTKVQAASLYATGTPLYTISGIGTDTYARTTAEWASNRANAAHSIASAAATGTPIYSVSGLATGTPIYSIAGLATGTPIYSVAGLATGTPLYVESYTGSVGSLSGYMPSAAVTTAINAMSFPLASGENVSQRVAAVEGAFIRETNNGGATLLNYKGSGTVNYTGTNGASVFGEINGTLDISGRAARFGGYIPLTAGAGVNLSGRSAFFNGDLGNANGTQTLSGIGSFLIGTASFTNTIHGAGAGIIGNAIGGVTLSGVGSLGLGRLAGFVSNQGDGAIVVGGGSTISTITSSGDGSLLLGSGTISNAYSIAVNGNVSHGNGSANFDSFWMGSTNVFEYLRDLSNGSNAPSAWTAQPSLLAVSNGVIAVGLVATNAQQTASNALAIANGADTDTVAQASILVIGAQTTNANIVASNGLATAQAAQVQASNIVAGQWSQILTNAADANNYAITNVDYIAFGTNTIDGTETNAIGIYNGHPSWVKAPGSVRTFASSDNLSSLGIQTTSGFNSSITNYARITPTGYSFPTSWNDSVGNNGDLVRSGTNAAFKSAGVWSRWTVVTNW